MNRSSKELLCVLIDPPKAKEDIAVQRRWSTESES
jgi:hypothetical protein